MTHPTVRIDGAEYRVFCGGHALQRLRERHPAAAEWTQRDADEAVAGWIRTGTEYGGQFRGDRSWLVNERQARRLAVVVVLNDGYALVRTILLRDHLVANSQQQGQQGAIAKRGTHYRRSKIIRDRYAKSRRDALAESEDDDQNPPNGRSPRHRRNQSAGYPRSRNAASGESVECPE